MTRLSICDIFYWSLLSVARVCFFSALLCWMLNFYEWIWSFTMEHLENWKIPPVHKSVLLVFVVIQYSGDQTCKQCLTRQCCTIIRKRLPEIWTMVCKYLHRQKIILWLWTTQSNIVYMSAVLDAVCITSYISENVKSNKNAVKML